MWKCVVVLRVFGVIYSCLNVFPIDEFARVNVSDMEASAGDSQFKGVTFVKMGIIDKFLEYAKKHIKKRSRRNQRRNHSLW